MPFMIACVLKSGGDYDAEYVERLHAGVSRYAPGARFVCLSDVDVPCERIPLKYDWPGWWSKMELFRPDIQGEMLFMDLDTVITGDLTPLIKLKRLAMLADFYKPERLASGLMFLPQQCREKVWRHWIADPQARMDEAGRFGDQKIIGDVFKDMAVKWQDALPGKVVSYKVHMKGRGNKVPDGASVVCFHGQPRPRELNWLEPKRAKKSLSAW